MIGYKVNAMQFFDRKVIKTNWRKINETPAKKAGLLVRKVAIRRIKKAETAKRLSTQTKPSKPGMSPKSRAPGHPYRRIYSVPELLGTRVTVGFIGLTSGGLPVPALHERGGHRRLSDSKRMALLAKQRQLFKLGRNLKGQRTGQGSKRPTLSSIKTTARYPQRPTMGPALAYALPKLPAMWRGSMGAA